MIGRFRDGDASYNSEDFLLEIEHFNTIVFNREKQIHENSIKVSYKINTNHHIELLRNIL
jgi:hypothetical protein